mgnify:FL=1
MELRSQAVRKLAPENDPLKIGMGWKVDDLAKPQIMVESTFGDSHPGSAHLDQFVKEAVQAVNTHGGKAARYFATDMCDGIAQGHDGINYSLPHRDAIVNLVEAQANATVYDGGVFIASCDKSMPAMLMSIGRLKDMSAIVVTGGVMEAHTLPKKYVVNDPACAINDLLTLEQIGKFDAWEKTGVIPNEQLDYYKHNACPSCGACSFMGTASTMQIMAEALGLMLPGTALMPATAPELKQAAYDAGVQVMKLVAEGIKAKDWAAYVGRSPMYYLMQFFRMSMTKQKVAVCLSAFLFGPAYLLYRKMWKEGLLTALLSLVLSVPSLIAIVATFNPSLFGSMPLSWVPVAADVCAIADWIVRILLGLFSVWLYRNTSKKKIDKIYSEYPEGDARTDALLQKGGTSIWAALLYFGIVLLLSSLVINLAGPGFVQYAMAMAGY